MKKRDETIDLLRALAMFWVIVVHVLYWGDFFSNDYINLFKSFCLFEMPLFFFVTGASHSFTKVNGYLGFVKKRFKRILIPYWVYAFICVCMSIAYPGMSGGIDYITAIKTLLSWTIPIDKQITSIPFLTWATWFIPVYLCVILIVPFLKKIKTSGYAIRHLFVHSAIFAITCFCKLGWIQNVVFYSLWTYIGLFYEDVMLGLNKCRFRRNTGFAALIGLVTMCVLYAIGQPLDMQYNKFPPNIMFGAFSVVMMSLILLMLPYINKVYSIIRKNKIAKKITDLFATRSTTIFLYQSFAFILTVHLLNLLIADTGILASVIKSIICLITTLPICAVLALILGRIENIGTGRCK